MLDRKPPMRSPPDRGEVPAPATSPRRGWTLLELLIAVGIVGVLAAIAVPTYLGHLERARIKSAVVDIRNLSGSVDLYRFEFREYPDDLAIVLDGPALDPWGNAYEYLRIEGAGMDAMGQVRKDKNLVPLNSDYDLYSRGPDGATHGPLTAQASHDDVIRAADGAFIGLATEY